MTESEILRYLYAFTLVTFASWLALSVRSVFEAFIPMDKALDQLHRFWWAFGLVVSIVGSLAAALVVNHFVNDAVRELVAVAKK